MSHQISIAAHVHAHDAPIQADRCVSSSGRPYYRLHIGGLGGACLFLDPHRIADLIGELQRHADTAAADCQAKAEAA